ncbi:hypothetical protein COLO4_07241 [Corchorus olitorius]|uniref:Uncharacterized protein n=1 Tax=Corchorus olitorius TaxID=93759 RepID=A0A1R3KKD8_9ROSI|nr:hypothetical protein COLO4_07241 [Corchorus olitorius]
MFKKGRDEQAKQRKYALKETYVELVLAPTDTSVHWLVGTAEVEWGTGRLSCSQPETAK